MMSKTHMSEIVERLVKLGMKRDHAVRLVEETYGRDCHGNKNV